MEHILDIIVGGSSVRYVRADMSVDFPLTVFPDLIEGRLLGLTVEELVQLKFSEDVVVGMGGKRYKFSQFEKDGTFVLKKDWP